MFSFHHNKIELKNMVNICILKHNRAGEHYGCDWDFHGTVSINLCPQGLQRG